jgi:hypothetical protein
MALRRSSAWTGWIVFAGIMIMVISSINIFEGFLALINNERVAVSEGNFVIVDMTSWGWTLVLSGIVLFGVGIGLIAGAGWARITSIVIIGVHAAAQVLWLGAYPIWSLLMITLDTIVLFALCARWSEVRPDLRSQDRAILSADGIPGEAPYGQLPHESPAYRRQVS